MTSTPKVWVDVVEFEVWAIHTKHVDGKVMMAIEVVMLLVGRGHNSDVGAIQAPSCRREPPHFEELACKLFAILWPPNDLIFQIGEGLGNPLYHSTNG